MDKYQNKDRTVGRVLELKAEKNGDKPFCFFEDDMVTYRGLDRIANSVGNSFLKLGLKKGDKVCVLMPNCLEFLYTMFGLAKSGITMVSINYHQKGNILAYMINNSDARALVVHRKYVDNVKAIEDELKNLEKLIISPDSDTAPHFRFDTIAWAQMLKSPDTAPKVEIHYSDIFCMQFTSGTTGASKAIMQPHNQYVFAGEKMIEVTHGSEGGNFYNWFPMYHFSGMGNATMSTLLSDSTMYMVETFSLRKWWDDLRRFKITATGGFGQILQLLMLMPESPDDRNHQVKNMICAWVPKDIQEAFEKRFNIILQDDYGLTEIEPVSIQAWDDRKPGTLGKGIEELEIKIFDDYDNELPHGSVGEIVCRPKLPFIMMAGYYKQPEATVNTWRNLWFHTGDFGLIDAEGYIHFVDRKKDAIRRRGENISSQELEQIIGSHPKIAETVAVPVPSELGEDEVKVIIRLNAGETLKPEELLDFCQPKMAYFMVPRFIEFVEDFPRSELGRVKKNELKTISDKTWDREKAGYKLKR